MHSDGHTITAAWGVADLDRLDMVTDIQEHQIAQRQRIMDRYCSE